MDVIVAVAEVSSPSQHGHNLLPESAVKIVFKTENKEFVRRAPHEQSASESRPIPHVNEFVKQQRRYTPSAVSNEFFIVAVVRDKVENDYSRLNLSIRMKKN